MSDIKVFPEELSRLLHAPRLELPQDFYSSQEYLGKCLALCLDAADEVTHLLVDACHAPGTWLKLPVKPGLDMMELQPGQPVLACHLDWGQISHTWEGSKLKIHLN
jgi:hypothetical protein